MTTYLKTQDPFDKNRKVKALRPTIRMGGTTSHNGKQDTPEMIKKSQAHHESNMRKHARKEALEERRDKRQSNRERGGEVFKQRD